jgi:hypothetical protein
MKELYKKIIISIVILAASASGALASEVDPLLKKLDLSGFIRTRGFYIGSNVAIPGSLDGDSKYKHEYYFDLFARTRLNLKLSRLIEIKSVFDVYAVFGKADFAIGNGSANLITRDIYTVLNFSKYSQLSLGLMPFYLSGGYILARDAAGIKYEHKLFKKKLNLYSGMVFAYDDAQDTYGSQSDPPLYAGDYVFYVGAQIKPVAYYSSDTYYVLEVDYYLPGGSDGDSDKKGVLHWVGYHGKLLLGDFFINLGGILNFGFIHNYEYNSGWDYANTKDVFAGLWELSAGYRISNFQVSLAFEGATGDSGNASVGSSFQDIKASHGFSLIAVDNSGGIAVRGSGESPWYGLYGQGIKMQYDPAAGISLKLYYLHFRTINTVTYNSNDTTWFGDEIDFLVDFKFRNGLSAFVHGGILIAQGAYTGESTTNGIIGEISVGVKVVY